VAVSRPRILVYRALGLGDFLTAVPAYRALRAAFPAYDVLLAAPEPLRPLVQLTGGVDGQIPTEELAPPAWCGEPPDVAVNLHGKGPQSHRLLLDLRPARLIAFANAAAGVDGPSWRADEHEVWRWCRLLEASGVAADPADLDLLPPSRAPVVAGATVVHPGAADPRRRWPADRFAEVARSLADAGHHVLVTGVHSERALAAGIAQAAGLPADRVLAGRLDLGDLAALVAAARVVICGDTGVAHLATAYRIPSVLLFGPMSPALWGPPPARDEHRVLWAGPRAGGSPDEPDPGLMVISPPDVLAAVGSVLAADARVH
jgi:ADP-heptose:LPS heptosyltransferase